MSTAQAAYTASQNDTHSHKKSDSNITRKGRAHGGQNDRTGQRRNFESDQAKSLNFLTAASKDSHEKPLNDFALYGISGSY